MKNDDPSSSTNVTPPPTITNMTTVRSPVSNIWINGNIYGIGNSGGNSTSSSDSIDSSNNGTLLQGDGDAANSSDGTSDGSSNVDSDADSDADISP